LKEETGADLRTIKAAIDKFGEEDRGSLVTFLEAAMVEQGKKASEARAHRSAHQGLLLLRSVPGEERRYEMLELNCESDFAARSAEFGKLLAALATSSVEGRKDVLAQGESELRERLVLRRATELSVPAGVHLGIASHSTLSGAASHSEVAGVEGVHGVGTALALVHLEAEPALTDADAVATVDAKARLLASHIIGFKPSYVTEADIPAEVLEAEVAAAKARADADPDLKAKPKSLKRIVSDLALMQQQFPIDPKAGNVSRALSLYGKEVGATLRVASFQRFALGESIDEAEKQAAQAAIDNFAREVHDAASA
jgi:elongation factor Ts